MYLDNRDQDINVHKQLVDITTPHVEVFIRRYQSRSFALKTFCIRFCVWAHPESQLTGGIPKPMPVAPLTAGSGA